MALVAVYAFARPAINERMGWTLPDLKVDSSGQVVRAESHSGDTSAAKSKSAPGSEIHEVPPESTQWVDGKSPETSTKSPVTFTPVLKPDPARKRKEIVESKPTGTAQPAVKSTPPSVKPAKTSETKPAAQDKKLLYGLLRDLGGERYVSPAGLQYTPGSAEGHRVEHVRRHAEDDPGRPGSHGVFDGGLEGALKTIDSAYEKAKVNQRTTKEVDGNRVIYTVDMGKRVGFVGGRDGARKRNPMARRVMIVLEGTQVITAYPK